MPPLVGTAVNDRDCPVQVGFVPVVIEVTTAGTTLPADVIVIAVDVAVVGLAQLRLEVITQVTTCPFVNVEDVNVALFVPTADPSTFHW